MPARVRNVILALCTVILVVSIGAWVATGMRLYTDFPEARGASAAIGLLPSGPGRASISVGTIGGPAVLAAFGAWLLSLRRAGRPTDRE